jgi:hypothetical protein
MEAAILVGEGHQEVEVRRILPQTLRLACRAQESPNLRRSRIQIRLQTRHQMGHTKQGHRGTKIESHMSTVEDQAEEVRCKKTEAHTGVSENLERSEKDDGVVELDGLQAQEM